MARQQRFIRKVDKNGKVYYNELKKDSKGITRYVRTSDVKGAKAFVKKNFDTLKNDYTNLTPKEKTSIKRSKAQKSLFRWNGKSIKKDITNFLTEEGIIPKNAAKDLSKANLPNLRRPSDLEREYNSLLNRDNILNSISQWGNVGSRGRIKAENIVSIREELDKWLNQGFVLEVNDFEKQYIGNNAWAAIKRFETNVFETLVEENSNVAFVKFDYKIYIDSQSKRIEINLSEATYEVMYSDPIKRATPSEKEQTKKKKR
jgi:hypothetical protein